MLFYSYIFIFNFLLNADFGDYCIHLIYEKS